MPRKKIYDNDHQQHIIYNWKRRGLICRGDETYKDIYNKVMSVTHCELCNVEFTEEKNKLRSMDHSHETGLFRKVLCNKCNLTYDRNLKNKIGHKWICVAMTKNKSGNYSVSFYYRRTGFKAVKCQSLTKLIALSFINLLKEPI